MCWDPGCFVIFIKDFSINATGATAASEQVLWLLAWQWVSVE